MKKNILKGLLLGFSITVYFSFNIIFFLLITGHIKKEKIYINYNIEKLAFRILEANREGVLEDIFDYYREIKGFAIYDSRFEIELGYGDYFTEEEIYDFFLGNVEIIFDKKSNSFIFLRQIGGMGNIRSVTGINGNILRYSDKILFLKIDAYNYQKNRILYFMMLSLFPIILLLLIIVLALLYRKNESYKIKIEEHQTLAKLGEASRTLAHEIKNPLGAINIQLGYLKKIAPENIVKEFGVFEYELDRIKSITDRIGDFLRDPLGFPQEFNVINYINEIIKNKKYRFIIEDNTIDADIFFDKRRFESIIENALNNAMGSQDEAENIDPIKIIADNSKDFVIISIVDKGIGLRDKGKDIFQPYYTTKTKGSGIGLSIVKRFIEANGGKIEIYNNDDRGATAKLYIKKGKTKDENTDCRR
jgi:signal transduction histidine kinase